MENTASYPWMDEFAARHGRAPRVLLFGNICNNAYHIAKMLNAAGADCDVASVDYYFIMGTPEWDEADFTGDIESQMYPAWHKVDLHGYKRPEWFAQGRRDDVIGYLTARRRGDEKKMRKYRRRMRRHLRYLSRREASRFKAVYGVCEKLADVARMAARYLFKSPALFFLKLKRRRGGLNEAETQRMLQLEGITGAPQRIAADAAACFPGEDYTFSEGLLDYLSDAANYKELFSLYDVVHCFTMDPIWPYLAGCESYVAYENGTLRYMPEDKTDVGKLAMLAYAKASAVMVTNTDCYDNALYITKHSGAPIVPALHGLDITRMAEKVRLAGENQHFDGRFGVPKDMPLFYCPSRHTWHEGLGVFLKGEDKAIRAAARLAEEGRQFRLVLAAWGEDVDKIKAMVNGIPALSGMVAWQPPLEKHELHKAFVSVDVVLDQFYWLVFGAITFEVLCADTLLISQKVDDERMRLFFGDVLPYEGCHGEDDIYEAMKRVLDAPGEAQRFAQTGREWILAHHSEGQIIARCLAAYNHCIPLV